ncbi:hypothetical protein ABZV60_35750 [Streptomyces sp. NPDC004787]|uniref:hypothetical protein n=1 Tax=Streptomyces sp. NPDC004787 TaxID=3154291 RepID=UPI0033A88AB7
MAHDAGNWFFTGQRYAFILRVPVSVSLNSYIDPSDPDTWRSTTQGRLMPKQLRDAGYEDFKDLDQVNGFLFIPVAGTDRSTGRKKAGIAVFKASDLSYLGVHELAGWSHSSAAFFNRRDGFLYVSRSSVSATSPLSRFRVDFSMLASGNVTSAFTKGSDRYLSEKDGLPIQNPFRNIQGATFDPNGELYLVNGLEDPPAVDRGGIHEFDTSGRLVQDSKNGTSDFNFRYDPSEFPIGEEPEGADWWDLDALPFYPNRGQLHVILLDNDVFTPDNIFFKHYKVGILQ